MQEAALVLYARHYLFSPVIYSITLPFADMHLAFVQQSTNKFHSNSLLLSTQQHQKIQFSIDLDKLKALEMCRVQCDTVCKWNNNNEYTQH